MVKIFSEVLRLSALSGIMVLAVLAIRFFLNRVFSGKMPKSLCCFLWMLVGIRLMIPFSVESAFGLFREGESLPGWEAFSELGMQGKNGQDQEAVGEDGNAGQAVTAGVAGKRPLAFLQPEEYREQGQAFRHRERTEAALKIGCALWCAGLLLMMSYFVYSWIRIKRCVRMSVPTSYPLAGGTVVVRRCGGIETPFLFGILYPEIYVPLQIAEEDMPYIVRHELAHRRRRDHLVKPLAFLLLAVHWFNPFIWLAYRMLCKDMELACDEMVIRDMEVKDRKAYSRALLNCSVWREKAGACPVAFGELSVKERVKNVLNYKKPGILAICLGVVICVGLLCGFMTQRKAGGPQSFLLTNEAGAGTDSREEERQSDAIMEEQENADSDVETQAQTQPYALAGLKEWARAFCDRDGNALVSLCSQELLETFREGTAAITLEGDENSFGWSSPWPWDDEGDFRIVNQTDSAARILYYAWTSDPHVSVWEENLTYHMEDGRLVMDSSEMTFLDGISSGEEFYRTYPDGVINGTEMDYLSNGAGEALNNNALGSRDIYEPLFEPDTAARFLLNLLNNPDKVAITVESLEEGETEETARVSIDFILDHEQVNVTMIRPYGEDGIWIPQTYLE